MSSGVPASHARTWRGVVRGSQSLQRSVTSSLPPLERSTAGSRSLERISLPSKREVLGDFYYRQAKMKGYRSRSAFKLKEIARSQGLMKPGQKVADLGAAPGGWLQVERELVGQGGLVVGMDLSTIQPLPYENVKTIRGD